MKRPTISTSALLFRSLLYMGLGLFMVIYPFRIMKALYWGVVALFGVLSVSELLGLFAPAKGAQKRPQRVLPLCACLGALAFVLCWPETALMILPMVMGLWAMVNGALHTVSYIQFYKNDVPGRLGTLLSAILSYIFGLTLFFNARGYIPTVALIAGIYLMLYGAVVFGDFWNEVHPVGYNPRKRRFRITLPVWLAAFLPYTMISRVNQIFRRPSEKTKPSRQLPEEDVFDAVKEETPPDMEVFIHTSPDGVGMFGHVDLYFDGQVITYGCYDDRTKWFFDALGEGHMLFIADRETYIPFCIHESNKTIFGFGLRLDEEQKQSIREKLQSIQALLIPWYSDAQLARMGRLPKDGHYDDYASLLSEVVPTRFYKFKSGKFKTYFVLGTNCVLLADQLIGAAGTDILKVGGIITPGTYYDYLNREFLRNNSLVISRKAYTAAKCSEQIARIQAKLDAYQAEKSKGV